MSIRQTKYKDPVDGKIYHQVADNNDGKILFQSEDLAEVKAYLEEHKAEVLQNPLPSSQAVPTVVSSAPQVSTMQVPTATVTPGAVTPQSTVEAFAFKMHTRYTFDMVDSYMYEGKGCSQRVFEGENVGISGVLSTIAVPLRVDKEVNKDGSTKEVVIFIPHTFIQKMTVETFFPKEVDIEKK